MATMTEEAYYIGERMAYATAGAIIACFTTPLTNAVVFAAVTALTFVVGYFAGRRA